MAEHGEKEKELLQRSVFDWVPTKTADGGRALQHELVTADEVANEYGAPRYLVIEYLNHEINQASSCKSLPFTILLVVSYACVAIAHMDAPTVRAVEHSVGFDIEDNANFASDSEFMGHKDIYDVNSHTDFWSFMAQGLVPLLFVQERSWSEDLSARNEPSVTQLADGSLVESPALEPGIAPFEELKKSDWGMFIIFNRIVGGIRLRQERAPEEDCKLSPILNKFYGRKCRSESVRQYNLDPDLEVARSTVDPDENYTRWLYVHRPADDIARQVFDLEAMMWLDDYTTKIEIGVPIYNAEYSVHSLITVNFYFQRGGHIFKHIITQSCYATWFTRWYHYAADMIYLSCISWMLVREVLDIIHTFNEAGLHGIRTEYLNPWNIIDWLSIICGSILMGMFWMATQNSNVVNKAAEDFGVLRPIPGNVTEIPEVEKYMDELELAVNYVTFLQRWLARYPLIVVFRLFKAFHAQPRLALVSKTIQSSSIDLFHYLLVCFCVMISFVTSGVMLFGREVDELATIPRGFIFCFLLLLGDMDFDTMREAGRELAATWLCIFCVFVTLLLMNMLLAIVMDTYSDVKSSSTSAVTLWEQVFRSLEHLRGHHVPLAVILKYVEANTLEQFEEHVAGAEADVSQYKKDVGHFKRTPIYKRELIEILKHPIAKHSSWRQVKPSAGKRILSAIFAKPAAILYGKRAQKEYHMTDAQAHEILLGAIHNHYWANAQNAEPFEFIKLGARIDERIHKISHAQHRHDLDEAGKSPDDSAGHLNVKQVMTDLRAEVDLFLQDVEADRSRACKEWSRLGAEVDALRSKLQQLGQPATAHGAGIAAAMASMPLGTGSQRSNGISRGDSAPRQRASASRLAPLDEEPQDEDPELMDEDHAAAPSTNVVSPGLNMVRAPAPLSLPPGSRDADASGPDRPLGSGTDPNYVSLLQKQGLLPASWVPSELSQLTPEWPEEVSMPSDTTDQKAAMNGSYGRDRARGTGSSDAGSSRGGRRKDWNGMSGMSDFSDPSFADDFVDPEIEDIYADEDRLSGVSDGASPFIFRDSEPPRSNSGQRIHASSGRGEAPGVGLASGLGKTAVASPDPLSANALPAAALASPQGSGVEFTNFRDAQSQLRHMLSKHSQPGV